MHNIHEMGDTRSTPKPESSVTRSLRAFFKPPRKDDSSRPATDAGVRIASRPSAEAEVEPSAHVRTMQNAGNTCYVNATLQSLVAVLSDDDTSAELGPLLGHLQSPTGTTAAKPYWPLLPSLSDALLEVQRTATGRRRVLVVFAARQHWKPCSLSTGTDAQTAYWKQRIKVSQLWCCRLPRSVPHCSRPAPPGTITPTSEPWPGPQTFCR